MNENLFGIKVKTRKKQDRPVRPRFNIQTPDTEAFLVPKFRRTRFPTVLNSTPINKNALNAFLEGEHYEVDLPQDVYCCRIPLPVISPTEDKIKEIIGMRVGRLVVIGQTTQKHLKILLRCDCGNYITKRLCELRRVIFKYQNKTKRESTMCHECYKKLMIREKYEILHPEFGYKITEDTYRIKLFRNMPLWKLFPNDYINPNNKTEEDPP